ncbi:MAG TPA: hypothetical protein VNC84_04045 [Gammaproteobacteria bacterium]|jgi:hypothetical protein|nr:hypothetical protein [Gammaproteobacteria bacterium]
MQYGRVLGLLLVIFLVGCASQTKFSYTPPASSADRACIDRCRYAKTGCERICRMKDSRCFDRADRAAYPQYTAYVQQRKHMGLPIKKKLADFADYRYCKASCHCIESYNTCYSACGGRVRPLS